MVLFNNIKYFYNNYIIHYLSLLIIKTHSYLINYNNITNQFYIPILLDNKNVIIPMYKYITSPLIIDIEAANDNQKKILTDLIKYKFGFENDVKIKIEVFKDLDFAFKEIIV